MSATTLLTIDPRGIATVMLNRPEQRNSLNAELLRSLLATLTQLDSIQSIRVVVLTGAGNSFCAGMDMPHTQLAAASDEQTHFSDALAITRCLRQLAELNKPVIARINGNALGSGVGLVCCADIAIASSQAKFGFPEVQLGLSPSIIAPYVLAAIGQRHSRRLMLTAASISAQQALQLGLIHQHVDAQELDAAIEQEIELLLQGAPLAQQVTKKFVRSISAPNSEQHDLQATRSAKVFAQLRVADECREGLQATIEKRTPDWFR